MDALYDEIESLEAILMDDVRVTKNLQTGVPEMIETTVFPLVDEESEQQYICVTLQVLPKQGYPDTSPDFKLIRPRGLDDSRLESIRSACAAKLADAIGFPVVFDLIEVVRELLTNTGNLPSGQCVVCLYGFADGDDFTRTECFHYLHSYCLARHLNALRRNYHEEFDKLPAWLQKTADPFQAACPVCREPIKDESDSLKCAMPPSELQNAPEFTLTKELRELQQRMSALFLEQKNRGAIIDVEAESGAIISIETEEEIRRRLQRKQENCAGAAASSAAPFVARIENGNTNGNASSSCSNSGAGSSGSPNVVDSIKATGSQSSIQQQSNDKRSEQANSHHEQPNRRHYRGGRRHQHHHYHHNRERERERFEQNHVPHTSSNNTAGNGTGAAAVGSGSGTGTVPVANAGGKHSKSHSHAR